MTAQTLFPNCRYSSTAFFLSSYYTFTFPFKVHENVFTPKKKGRIFWDYRFLHVMMGVVNGSWSNADISGMG
jgi:hypothetical protein